jgi:uncharacterized protein
VSDASKTQQLFEAIERGHAESVRTMIHTEPHLANATVSTGHGTLHAAALYDRPEVVPILTELGARLELTDPVGKVTALQLAVMQNHGAVVLALLKAGASVQTRNAIGWTPLHDAAYGGNISLIDLLLSHSADINATDDTGNTPAAIAVLNGEVIAAKYLRERGGRSHVWGQIPK